MATSTTTAFPSAIAAGEVMPVSGPAKRRSIDQQSGRALVILGHAIEYLADEFVHQGGTFTTNRGQVEAIQLLTVVNKQIYVSCPEAPTLGQWLRSILKGRFSFGAAPEELSTRRHHGRV